jgi:hypothetical protein
VVAYEACAAGSFTQGVARSLLQHAPNDRHRQVMVERPGQKLTRACAKRCDHFGGRALAGHSHDRSPRLTGLRGAYHLRSAVREIHVHNTEIENLCTQLGTRRLPGGSHNILALQRRDDMLEG